MTRRTCRAQILDARMRVGRRLQLLNKHEGFLMRDYKSRGLTPAIRPAAFGPANAATANVQVPQNMVSGFSFKAWPPYW